MTRPVFVITLACLLSACSGTPDAGGVSSVPEGARRFRFTYETTVPAPEPGTTRLSVWLPLPLQDPGVQVVGPIAVDAPGARIAQTTERKYGNRMLHVTVENPAGPTSISWSATVTRWIDVGQGTLPDNPWFSRANDLIPIDGEAARLARDLGTSDDERPVATRARIIYDDVLEAMAYDKKHLGWGLGSFEHATTVCMGNCTDFHARFIGTARASGIACRFTMGIPMKPGAGSYRSYHCWAHWRDGDHWRPVDISEADKIVQLDPEGAQRFFGEVGHDRLALSLGRDITLSPPQAGPPLNYFVFPYAEADGKPVPLDQENWKFSWIDV